MKKQAHFKWLCCHCLKSGKGRDGTCGTQGHKIVSVSHKLYFPKKTASKTRWKKMLLEDTWAGANLESRDPDAYKALLKAIKKKRK